MVKLSKSTDSYIIVCRLALPIMLVIIVFCLFLVDSFHVIEGLGMKIFIEELSVLSRPQDLGIVTMAIYRGELMLDYSLLLCKW